MGLNTPSIYGWQGVVLVYTLQFFPFVFLMVAAAINSVDRSLEESARNLGASPWRAAGRHARHCLRRAHRVLHVH